MADARPTLVHGAAIYAQHSRTVQPPDDRTYSAEVTSFPSNLLHHRSARVVIPCALSYDTTPLHHCQALFREKYQNLCSLFRQNRDLVDCAAPRNFIWVFHKIAKLSMLFAKRRRRPQHTPFFPWLLSFLIARDTSVENIPLPIFAPHKAQPITVMQICIHTLSTFPVLPGLHGRRRWRTASPRLHCPGTGLPAGENSSGADIPWPGFAPPG